MHELARSPVVPRAFRAAALRVGRFLADALARILAHAEARRCARILRTFDERMLRDIGLHRDDIDRVVRHGRD